MASYQYRCSNCGSDREVSHSMQDNPNVDCRMCDFSTMYRVPQLTATQFKGSGFASNDLRSK